MTDIHCEVQPHDSVTLEPDTEAELVFFYTNHNEEVSHHVRSLLLSPTWNLDKDIQHEINTEIGPGETVSLQPLEVEIPEGVGGHQGFLIRVEVRDGAAEAESYEQVTIDSISRVPVNNAEQYRALICGADSGEFAVAVRRLLANWGFDLNPVDDHQMVVSEFKHGDPPPTCVVGILSTSENQYHHLSLISSSATTALFHDADALIFVHEQIETPELPNDVSSVKVDPADPIQLERDVGPELRDIRQMGTHAELIERVKVQAEKKPRELVNDYINDKILSAVEKAGLAAGGAAAEKVADYRRRRSEESLTTTSGSVDEHALNVQLINAETDEPIPDGTVTLMYFERADDPFGPRATDDDGKVIYEDIDLEGKYNVRGRAAGYTGQDQEFIWKEGNSREITLALEPEEDVEASILTVTVVEAETGDLVQTLPHISIDHAGEHVKAAPANDQGRARISLEDGREYTVSAMDEIPRSSEERTVTVDGDTEITLEL